MGAFDASLGALLIGTWANAMLFMLEFTQVVRYFSLYPKDGLALKALVFSIFTVDVVGTAATFGTVYMYCITFWGKLDALEKEYWSYPVYCTATALSAALGQGFLISRLFNLSQNYVLAVLLSLAALLAFGGAMATVVLVAIHNTLEERDLLTTPVIIWFGGSTACDVLLALCLVWQLRNVKSPFRNTQTMLRRLTQSSISTGSVTGAWAFCILIVFVQKPSGSIAVAFNTCFGRVYALTVLYNLNCRNSIRGMSAKDLTTAQTSADFEADFHPSFDLTQTPVEQTVNMQSDNESTKGPTFYNSGDHAEIETQYEDEYEPEFQREIKNAHRIK